MYNPYAQHTRQVSESFPSSTAGPGGGPGASSNFNKSHSISPALAARISAKKQELENLRQLRDLSANVASQLKELETKLDTLTNGTEAVATVLANWGNVLRAINMASMKVGDLGGGAGGEEGNNKEESGDAAAAGEGEEGEGGASRRGGGNARKGLPEQLVRVPMGLQ